MENLSLYSWERIVSLLPPFDILKCCLICKKFANWIKSDEVAQKLMAVIFPYSKYKPNGQNPLIQHFVQECRTLKNFLEGHCVIKVLTREGSYQSHTIHTLYNTSSIAVTLTQDFDDRMSEVYLEMYDANTGGAWSKMTCVTLLNDMAFLVGRNTIFDPRNNIITVNPPAYPNLELSCSRQCLSRVEISKDPYVARLLCTSTYDGSNALNASYPCCVDPLGRYLYYCAKDDRQTDHKIAIKYGKIWRVDLHDYMLNEILDFNDQPLHGIGCAFGDYLLYGEQSVSNPEIKYSWAVVNTRTREKRYLTDYVPSNEYYPYPNGAIFNRTAVLRTKLTTAEVWDVVDARNILTLELDTAISEIAMDNHKIVINTAQGVRIYDSNFRLTSEICQQVRVKQFGNGGSCMVGRHWRNNELVNFDTEFVNKLIKVVLVPPLGSALEAQEISIPFASIGNLVVEKNGCSSQFVAYGKLGIQPNPMESMICICLQTNFFPQYTTNNEVLKFDRLVPDTFDRLRSKKKCVSYIRSLRKDRQFHITDVVFWRWDAASFIEATDLRFAIRKKDTDINVPFNTTPMSHTQFRKDDNEPSGSDFHWKYFHQSWSIIYKLDAQQMKPCDTTLSEYKELCTKPKN